MALGYGVLALALCAGVAAPVIAWRHTPTRRLRTRVLWLGGACVLMLALWLAGFALWLVAFVLPC